MDKVVFDDPFIYGELYDKAVKVIGVKGLERKVQGAKCKKLLGMVIKELREQEKRRGK